MPLDVTASRQTTTAELHYLKRTAEKPARYVMEPPPGVPQWNGFDDPRQVTIADARGRESAFSLDHNGFALIKAPTEVRDFYNPDQIKSVYYPEVERLLREAVGASRVVVFDHKYVTPSVTASRRRRGEYTTIIPSTRRQGGTEHLMLETSCPYPARGT